MPPAPLTDEQHRALGALDEERLVAGLVALVQAPSVTGTDVESDQQHAMAATSAQLGLDTDLWSIDLDELRADPDFPGTEAERAEGYGLVGTTAGEGEPALILHGHIDVVPTGDLTKWDGDPFSGRSATVRCTAVGPAT